VAAQALMGLWAALWRRLAPGVAGEEIACRHLLSRGYRILDRNFRCRSGEVDIVARQGDATVFVEVKERHGESHGRGQDAVSFGKRLRVIRAARLYAARRGLSEGPVRFDVVSVDWEGRRPRVRHEEAAFDSDGL
jgi:putative endonuclease